MVRPTNSGGMVEARAQVLMIVRSSLASSATFLASLKSMNGPFFSERLIPYSLFPLSRMTAPYDELGCGFAAAGLEAQSLLAPWGAWVFTHTMTATVTTTVRVVGSIHDDTTNTWADTLVTRTASFADFDVLVLFVPNNTY